MAISPEAEAERKKIKNGFNRHNNEFPCVAELAARAVDTSFSGFEDPRVASLEALSSYGEVFQRSNTRVPSLVECVRKGCSAEARIHVSDDTTSLVGVCALQEVCVNDIWDRRKEEPEAIAELLDESLVRRSDEQIGFICPHIGCNFNCGFTVEGYDGAHNACMKASAETAVSLPAVAPPES